VKGKSPVEIRMELARGHFLVGEPAHALAALEAAVREDPRHPGLRALIEELMADPTTYTVRTSLDAVRARLGASVARPAPAPAVPRAVEPDARPRPAAVELEDSVELEDGDPVLELEPLAESAGIFAKPAVVPAKPAPARPAVEKPAVALEAPAPAQQPGLVGRARTLAELERWLRNVPRIKRAEVRA
jgi:hypothetical protein